MAEAELGFDAGCEHAGKEIGTDWLSHAWLVPSWLISLLLHAIAFLVIATCLREWQAEPAGFSDEPSREVGIVLKSAGVSTSDKAVEKDAPNEVESIDPQPTETPTPMPVAKPTTVTPSTPGAAPSPDIPLPAIGTGTMFPSAVQADPRELIKSGSPVTASGALAAAMPGAAFMGARDNGTRIVFAIDCSASMSNYGAMRSAKAALVSSLQTLTDSQQFQIVFYNQRPNLLSIRGSTDLAFATEVNKALARQYISGIDPSEGTDHMPALRMALRLTPEVLFFLTDADEPQLSPAELNEIQRMNQGRTRIHTIEFGTDGELNLDNFLKKLARQNGGTYRYYDVKRIAPR
ncbi:MAG: hypothetical protein B7Z55_16885 [Planctomycetales bacterium 12-60-4]|nr:MAG: hypothetical protein B7Z55_16885 [Planctomycetales bacterium 12-60-4]